MPVYDPPIPVGLLKCMQPKRVAHERSAAGMHRHSRGYLAVRVLYGTLRITIGNSKHSALHMQIKNKWTHSTTLSSTPVILTPSTYPTLMHKAI